MRFNVLGHETHLSLDHLLLVAFSLILIASFALVGGSASEVIFSFRGIDLPFGPVLSSLVPIFGLPVLAYFILLMAKWTKKALDELLCRSLSFSFFLILSITYIAITIGTSSANRMYDIPYYVSLYALAAFMLYLWMLAFIRRDLVRAETAFPLAVAYGFVMFLTNQLFGFVSAYYAEVVFLPDLSFSALVASLQYVVLGFAVFYSAYERKLDGTAYAFVVLTLLPSVLALIIAAPIFSVPMSGYFVSFLSALLGLIVLFVLAKMKND